jgi:predicted AAA+ superfamily ATPase
MAIRGPRGVGKTTMMRQYIKQHYAYMDRQVLYVSCDDAYFSTRSLLDLAEQFYLIGGKHLFIDEIHKYENWRKNSLSRLCISFLLCTFAAVNCYGKRTGMSNEVFMHDYFNDDELELLW